VVRDPDGDDGWVAREDAVLGGLDSFQDDWQVGSGAQKEDISPN
jgi:hypothetical protein